MLQLSDSDPHQKLKLAKDFQIWKFLFVVGKKYKSEKFLDSFWYVMAISEEDFPSEWSDLVGEKYVNLNHAPHIVM